MKWYFRTIHNLISELFVCLTISSHVPRTTFSVRAMNRKKNKWGQNSHVIFMIARENENKYLQVWHSYVSMWSPSNMIECKTWRVRLFLDQNSLWPELSLMETKKDLKNLEIFILIFLNVSVLYTNGILIFLFWFV